jgi:hypothetical protein
VCRRGLRIGLKGGAEDAGTLKGGLVREQKKSPTGAGDV